MSRKNENLDFMLGYYGAALVAALIYLMVGTSSCSKPYTCVTTVDGQTVLPVPGPSGPVGKDGLDGKDGSAGHSSVYDLITETTCEAGGYTLVVGTDTNDNGLLDITDSNLKSLTVCNGVNGKDGQDGEKGDTGVKGDTGETGSQGATGATGSTGSTGPAGPQGIPGAQGSPGPTGSPGPQGSPAPASSFTPVKVVTPCGPNSSTYKEVLLVLADGSILASFSENANGKNTRLALIPDGSYVDTDSSACSFTVTTVGHTRYITWSGGGDSWSIL